MKRIGFYPTILTLILVLSSSLTFAAGTMSRFTGFVPVLQGYTNESTSFITALRNPGEELTYEISNKDAVVKVKTNSVGQGHEVDTLEVSGLKPGIDYELIIKNKYGKVIDSREFTSLNQLQEDPKIAVCSCSRIGMLSPDDKQRSMWDRLMDQKPNAIFFLGDLVYGDNAAQAVLKWAIKKFHFYHPSFNYIEKRYIESWKKERIYRQAKMIPMYTVWDDHDYGYDAADFSNPFKKKMLDLFRAYYPVPSADEVISRGPGVSYSFSIYGKKVLMLDNRSFYNVGGKVLLGMDQINWIEAQVKNQKEVVIASGMSIINITPDQESLQRDAPSEWQAFRNIFRTHGTKAVFLTGDVHYSEIREIPEHVFGYKTYVVVSSHMHSTSPRITPPFKSGKSNDPGQLAFVGGRNFAVLAMKSLFQKVDAVFYRHKGLAPIKFVGDYGTKNLDESNPKQECKHFYSASK
ncbi:MAG: alkaline phosphatase D family protein [Bdellovibrionaceae bacterium]|nr:alkaline phosphatase D family protein [Pseudobdellovibrionaceae bacterium]